MLIRATLPAKLHGITRRIATRDCWHFGLLPSSDGCRFLFDS